MDFAVNISNGMVNNLMLKVRRQTAITPQLIRVQSGTRAHMLFYDGLQRLFFAIWNDQSANIPAALFHAHYDYFVLNVVSLSGNTAGLDALVHVPRFSAD